MSKFLFTSESVTEGHPDKICDQISDAVLDEIMFKDPYGRVACESTCTTGQINVMGEISAECYIDIPKIVRSVLNDIGYDSSLQGFDGNTCAINVSIGEQSPEVALWLNNSRGPNISRINDSHGAGDQGMMFGFACDETPELMPLSISLAHRLAKQLSYIRKSKKLPYLCPDGKTQVTVEYEDGICKRIDAIVVSTQHIRDIKVERLREDVLSKVILPIIPSNLMDGNTKIYINNTGQFAVGGPQGDTGLTGRKIMVDTYGGFARHGGGAFSGKDPTKVDRSAAYAARYAAKNIVAAKLAKKCEVQLAYAIGVIQPVSIFVDTFGTGAYSDGEITDAIKKLVDFRPAAIIRQFDLRKPIYKNLASYGHMGREELNVLWEKTNLTDGLHAYFLE